MLGFKSLWTTLSDWKIVGQTLIQSIRLYPRLILWNSPLVIIVVVLSYIYFNFIINFDKLFIAPSLKMMYLSLIQFCFMVIVWSFVIFLIPYQLYNYFMKQKDSKILKFKQFLKKHLWPVIIETLKAFIVAGGYAGAGLATWCILFVLSVYFIDGLREQVQELVISMMTLLVQSPESLNMKSFLGIVMNLKAIGMLLILFFLCLTPSIIKAIQYIIVPFVVIFNKQFSVERKSLKISEKLSNGLILPFFLLFLLFYFLSLFIPLDLWFQQMVGEQNVLFAAYIKIFLGSLQYIFYTTFFCMIYFNQDKTVLE